MDDTDIFLGFAAGLFGLAILFICLSARQALTGRSAKTKDRPTATIYPRR